MFNDPDAVSMLQVRLLGGFGVERSGLAGAVSCWQRRSAKTLTKLLAAHPRHALHPALNSFGKALHAARHAFEPELRRRHGSTYLRLEDSMLALDMEHVAIDADRFEHLAQDGLRRRDIPVFECALAAYSGELLPEDRYEDWCAERRSFLAELHVRMQLALADALERRGAYNESADHLRAVLQKDQTREEVHRRLMRLYAEMGTPDQAVRNFTAAKAVCGRSSTWHPTRRRCCSTTTFSRAGSHRTPPARSGSGSGPAHQGCHSRNPPRAGRSSAARRWFATCAINSCAAMTAELA
jgi:DNA-binding SARP family transcriptional activator